MKLKSGCGCPGLPVHNKPDGFCGRKSERRSCVKVEVAALGSPSLISLMVSVNVKHQ